MIQIAHQPMHTQTHLTSVIAALSLPMMQQADEAEEEGQHGQEEEEGDAVLPSHQLVQDGQGGVGPVAGQSVRQQQEAKVEGRQEAVGQQLGSWRFSGGRIVEPVEGGSQ